MAEDGTGVPVDGLTYLGIASTFLYAVGALVIAVLNPAAMQGAERQWALQLAPLGDLSAQLAGIVVSPGFFSLVAALCVAAFVYARRLETHSEEVSG